MDSIQNWRTEVVNFWRYPSIGIAAIICASAFQSIVATPEQIGATIRQDENKALIRRWIEEGFNKKDLAVVDKLFAPEVVVNGQRVGRVGIKQSMRRFITAFPNLRVTITEVVAEADRIGIWYTVQGTQTGEFEGIRGTGKQVRWSGADLFRVEKDAIVECRFVDDSLGLLRQLGATITVPQ
jgi:steroid delta-isomerase-like uncharacterized protein